uniref:Uncharacterized protein n=1 Tax=Anopheles dirus TaxID=7168 RepID=A0A182NY48_9DIPT
MRDCIRKKYWAAAETNLCSAKKLT